VLIVAPSSVALKPDRKTGARYSHGRRSVGWTLAHNPDARMAKALPDIAKLC